MKKNNLHIYPSPFRFESRMLRTGKSLLEFNLVTHVIIASVWEKGLKEEEVISEGFTVKRFKLFLDNFSKNPVFSLLRYIEFTIKVFFYFRKIEMSHVTSHSLLVLPLGVLLKRYGKANKLIYDAHELETERNGLRGIAKKFSKMLEGKYISKTDYTIVVSPSIEEWYRSTYNIKNITTIRNVFDNKNGVTVSYNFREKFSIKEDACIFIYQGLIAKGRGIEILLDAFSKLDDNRHVIFMGFGNDVDKVQNATIKNSNIHFMPAVPPNEISFYTSGADIGISLIENTSLSYYYSLPNKFFEYIQCELPLIVSDFPDMSSLINKYECGWTTGVSAIELIKLIKGISENEIKNKKRGVSIAKEKLIWNTEKHKLKRAYQ